MGNPIWRVEQRVWKGLAIVCLHQSAFSPPPVRLAIFFFRLNFCLTVKFPGLWRASLWLEIELLFSPHPKVWKYLLLHRHIDYVVAQILHLRTYMTVKCQQITCTVTCYVSVCGRFIKAHQWQLPPLVATDIRQESLKKILTSGWFGFLWPMLVFREQAIGSLSCQKQHQNTQFYFQNGTWIRKPQITLNWSSQFSPHCVKVKLFDTSVSFLQTQRWKCFPKN